MQNIYVIRDLVALFVLGYLMYEFFSKCFECTGGMMDPVVMKYISVTIRDTLLTVGIWMLVPVEEEMVRNVHA